MNITQLDLINKRQIIFNYNTTDLEADCNTLQDMNNFLSSEIHQQLREISSLQKEIQYTQGYITLLVQKIQNIPYEEIKKYTETTKSIFEMTKGENTFSSKNYSHRRSKIIEPIRKQSRGELLLKRKKLKTCYQDLADSCTTLELKISSLKGKLQLVEKEEQTMKMILLQNRNFIRFERSRKTSPPEILGTLSSLKKLLFHQLDMDKIDQLRGIAFTLITEKGKKELQIRQYEHATTDNPAYTKKKVCLEEIKSLKNPVDASELREWDLFKQSMRLFGKIVFSFPLIQSERKRQFSNQIRHQYSTAKIEDTIFALVMTLIFKKNPKIKLLLFP